MSFADGRQLTSGGPPFVVELLAVAFLSTKTLQPPTRVGRTEHCCTTKWRQYMTGQKNTDLYKLFKVAVTMYVHEMEV
jgi:hypothetical protein